MVPWFIRHYSPWVQKIIVYDEQSTDGTREFLLVQSHKVELRQWPHRGLNDEEFIFLANTWYHEVCGRADWVAFVDMDELLYHPNMLEVLGSYQGDVIPSTGYALISPNGWPSNDGKRQLYEHVRTGHRQANYDKKLLHRPHLDFQHTIGRHTEPGWPRHDGKESADVGVKLLHCHHVGGVADTVYRNQRNWERAVNKKYAWNYLPEHNYNAKQNGSVAWVRDIIANNRLTDVISPQGLKIQFCSGGMNLTGWNNHDRDVDITKPLPFENESAAYIFCEHGIEHQTHQQAWKFLEECYRILKPEGTIRLAIPDICRMWVSMTQEYADKAGDGTAKGAIRSAIFNHGHQAAWNITLLSIFLEAVGFKRVRTVQVGESSDPVLRGIEQHGKTVGPEINKVETSVVEATK